MKYSDKNLIENFLSRDEFIREEQVTLLCELRAELGALLNLSRVLSQEEQSIISIYSL